MTRVVAEGFTPPEPSDFWQPLVGDGAFAFTRPMALMIISAVFVIALGLIGTRALKVVPSKGQFLFESMYDFVRNTIARDMLGEKNFKPYLPLLVTMFLMILVNNLFGVVPVLQYPTMSRFGFPVALTLIVFVLYLYLGFKRRGFVGYFKNLLPEGIPGWLKGPIFFIEFLTYFFTRPVTLSLRLFGNMFAGHILLLLMALGAEYMLLNGGAALKVMSVAPFLMYFLMTFFEILVEFLQAFIFTLLAALYISDSISEHH
ncbi:MAG: F0F1 ATP synthase subunit A [Brevibacterium aurantiacum]|nr:F0F1 ATP synthase subunit A [Brevibacterium aurantiacum]